MDMDEALGRFFLIGDQLLEVRDFSARTAEINELPLVYEVIRAEEGIPLFLEDYLQRLRNSFGLLQRKLPLSEAAIRERVSKLMKANRHTSGPVKLVFGAGDADFFLAFLMKPHLPPPEEYRSGVHTILMEATRQNPNIKIWNNALREMSVRLLAEANAYEAILVNPVGIITEGSRSNVFFIRNKTVFTTPAEEVLPGITRKKVLEVCSLHGIPVKEVRIAVDELETFDSCFLTGTARKIVPVRSIDHRQYETGTEMLDGLTGYFDLFVEGYLQKRR